MKRTFTLVVFTLLLPFLSALSCDPLCPGKPSYFDISGVKLNNWVVAGTAFPDGKFVRQIQEGDTVAWLEHYMRAVFEVSYYSQRESAGSGPSGAAFALTCDQYPISKESYDTLYVITRNEWDRTHPAGDTLNDIVDVALSYIGEPRDLNRFESLAGLKRAGGDIISYEAFSFRINREPEFKATPHAFKLVYHLRNGEVYEAETGNVWFK